MSLNSGVLGVGIRIDASDNASGVFKSAEAQFGKMSASAAVMSGNIEHSFEKVREFGKHMMGAAGGLYGSADSAGQFEQKLAGIGAVLRATTPQLEALRNSAIKAGIETQFTPHQAIEGLQSLTTAGMTANQAITTLLPTLDLAAGSLGQLGVESASEAIIGTLHSYNLEAKEASAVTDKLLRITELSAFQSRDFSGGLAKAAASAGVFNQSLDDTLVVMGMLRNRNIDASSSGTAFREMTRRMASDQGAWKALAGAHVEIIDKQTGKMRSVIEITQDFEKKTASWGEKRRQEAIVDIYGARGLLAYSAITKAMFTDRHTDEVLHGAAAIQAMRDQMKGATGTAAYFRDKLLDTFQGQKTLLHGTLETYKVVLGEPLAAIFKPVVKTFTDALNSVLGLFNSLPKPLKETFARIAAGVALFVSITGATIAAVAAFKLLALGAGFLGISFSGLMLTVLPVVAALGIIGLVAAGMWRNLGGEGWIGKARLGLDAIVMLFSRGGFTKQMWADLNKSGNEGVRDFAIDVYHWGAVIKNFLTGVWDGLVTRLELARPTFEKLGESVKKFARALGLGVSETTQEASKRFDEFGAKGFKLGDILGTVAEVGADTLSMALEGLSGFITQLRKDWPAFKASIDSSSESLKEIATTVNELRVALGFGRKDTADTSKSFESFGGMAAWVIGRVVEGITKMQQVFRGAFGIARGLVVGIIGVFESLWDIIAGFLSFFQGDFNMSWTDAWHSLARIVYGVIGAIYRALMTLVEGSAGMLDMMGRLAGKEFGFAPRVRAFKEETMAKMASDLGITGETGWNSGLTDTAGDAARRARKATSVDGPMSVSEGPMSLPGAGPVIVPTYSPNASSSSEELHRDLQEIKAAIKSQSTTVSVGGEALLSINKRESRSEAIASWDPGVSMTPSE